MTVLRVITPDDGNNNQDMGDTSSENDVRKNTPELITMIHGCIDALNRAASFATGPKKLGYLEVVQALESANADVLKTYFGPAADGSMSTDRERTISSEQLVEFCKASGVSEMAAEQAYVLLSKVHMQQPPALKKG